MKNVQNGLTETKYTEVYHEEDFKFNAPHHFKVVSSEDDLIGEKVLGQVDFQEGAIKEHGVNGVTNEDLIAMVVTRLEHFQNSDFRCRENYLMNIILLIHLFLCHFNKTRSYLSANFPCFS